MARFVLLLPRHRGRHVADAVDRKVGNEPKQRRPA